MPQNVSALIVFPRLKVFDINKKRLHWASVAPDSDNCNSTQCNGKSFEKLLPKAKLPLRNEVRIFSISIKNIKEIRERKNKMKRNQKE